MTRRWNSASTADSSSASTTSLAISVASPNARGVGERLVYTTAQPGQRWVFSAPLFVRAGNAAGVQVRQGDAQPTTLGSNGEVVNRTFTP